jgi:mono/diheme cytochrome c family protein
LRALSAWNIALVLLATTWLRAAAAVPTTEQVEVFEARIRPIFADHCYQCHSEKAEKLKGELRLDSPAAILKGGKSGPIIIPNQPDASLLIRAVRYTNPDLKMPPKGKKLGPEQIALLESWVQMGASVPSTSSNNAVGLTDIAHARATHWAFQPVGKPSLPTVRQAGWVRTPVDTFILAMLEKKGLQPASAADRRVLIRRVTYDLTGLAPTPEQTDEYLNDSKPDAYARLVERLLASPQYGERWGRYWLDVARYADTKGYLAGGEERRYAFSYTYRDYVIRAFNEDKPYDQFVIEQIAADLLPLGSDKRPLAALGFLTLGRRFLNNQNDIIDDRIDVISRGTLGLTVSCARCHDHKFDPIPTKDYYALHGVFASSHEPTDLPLLGELRDSDDYRDYLQQKEKIQGEVAEFKRKHVDKFLSELRQHVGEYLLGAQEAGLLEPGSKFDTFAGEHKLNAIVLRRWLKELEKRDNAADPIFGPWFRLSSLTNFPAESGAVLANLSSEKGLNSVILKTLQQGETKTLKDVAAAYSKSFQKVEEEWQAVGSSRSDSKAPMPPGFGEADREALRQELYGKDSPVNLPVAQAESILAQPISDGTAPLRNKIEALNWTHPGAPPRAMALNDKKNPENSHVLIRGNPGNPGEEVPRHFLQVLSSVTPEPFTNGSGRLELARNIVSPDNPLTARVYVNRVWLHHFGQGLVKTPGDFGVRTPEPVHRALLDYLAWSLVESGWSTKQLQRLIVLSATYQQSCESGPESVTIDPENNLVSHMNRQRLDFEALRDTLLEVSGKLDCTSGGLPVDLETEPFCSKRTIYGLIDRQNLPGVFRTFDFANPDTSSQQRFHTTVPQQALFLMNSPFVLEQARSLAHRAEAYDAKTPSGSIQTLYRFVFQRQPVQGELDAGEKFLQAQRVEGGKLSPLERYAQALLLSNELVFLD